MGGITGSTKNAAVRVEKFAAEVRGKLAKAAAPRIDALLQQQFATESDPYGKPLASLKASTVRRKRGNARILYRVGNLQPGTYALATGGRLVITYGPAAQYAQDGDASRGRVPRLVAPSYGIPKTWKFALEQAAADVAKAEAT
jgi:mRNA-degrading endonuclease RelE of RelBE toxin-antitoxin system